MKEENLIEDEKLMMLDEIDKFTYNPFEDDQLLHALPMCAPYSVVKNFKYKIKIMPGQMKRGKASKQIMQIWRSEANKTNEELTIKGIVENDVNPIIVSNLRIECPGLRKNLGKK